MIMINIPSMIFPDYYDYENIFTDWMYLCYPLAEHQIKCSLQTHLSSISIQVCLAYSSKNPIQYPTVPSVEFGAAHPEIWR